MRSRATCWGWAGEPEDFDHFVIPKPVGTQTRNIVRGEVQAIVDEEVTKVEQDLLWCMSHPDEAACKPAAPAHEMLWRPH